MWSEDGRVLRDMVKSSNTFYIESYSGQKFEIVHNDGDEEIEHHEGHEKDKRGEVGVGKRRAAFRV